MKIINCKWPNPFGLPINKFFYFNLTKTYEYMSLKNSIKEFEAFLGDKDSLLDTSYPGVVEMIKLHWGHKEIYLYINKLLVVDTDRNRQGFPLEALHEIYKLQEIHEKVYPGLKTLINGSLGAAARSGKNHGSMLV